MGFAFDAAAEVETSKHGEASLRTPGKLEQIQITVEHIQQPAEAFVHGILGVSVI